MSDETLPPALAGQVDRGLGPLPEPRIRLGEGNSTWDKYSREQMQTYASQEVAAERERCAHACREWQAGRLPHGIGTHDLLRAIEGPNVRGNRETTR